MQRFLSAILLASSLVQGAPSSCPDDTSQPQKQCKDYNFTVKATSKNWRWNLPPIEDNYDLVDFLTRSARRDAATAFHPILPPNGTDIGTYTVAGTFCQPSKGANGVVFIATPGGGFERTYWNSEMQPEKYNFVDYVLKDGYSVFFWDRLNTGKSQIVTGTIPQNALHASILSQLATTIRNGALSGFLPSKIVLIGHSLGSIITNSVLSTAPHVADAAILTGFAYNASRGVALLAQQPRLASSQDPARWGRLDGYSVVWTDVWSFVEAFLQAPGLRPPRVVVDYAQSIREPAGLMEQLTGSLGVAEVYSPDFAGPVLIISGENDLLACGGVCTGLIDAQVKNMFPNNTLVETYSHPGAGHAINFSLNATGAYETILNYLKKNNI